VGIDANVTASDPKSLLLFVLIPPPPSLSAAHEIDPFAEIHRQLRQEDVRREKLQSGDPDNAICGYVLGEERALVIAPVADR